MTEKGWNVWIEGDTLAGQNPPEQWEEFAHDSDVCQVETWSTQLAGRERTPEFVREKHDELLVFHACLLEHGFAPPDVPSYAELEELMLVEGDIFDLATLTGVTPEDLEQAGCENPLHRWGGY